MLFTAVPKRDLLQSLCLAWTSLQDILSMMPWKKHLQQIKRIRKGQQWVQTKLCKNYGPQLCPTLPLDAGKETGSPPGIREASAHYHPCSHLHYICNSAASHQHTSCWEGKWVHSDHWLLQDRVEACGEGGGMSLWKTCGFRAMRQLHRLL